ncbi:MAG: Hsp33 family molecular chaperone HslO [Acutalibacteraceae bacterium]
MLAGGLLIQALPGADDAALKLEKNVVELPSVTTITCTGLSIEDICRKALTGFDVEILDEYE